jgi:quinol-cytochrome oxidoreductase complex cytochrome b subunit
MKSHLQSYPCPLQINSFWNLGFLLGITIILQIITGIFLGLHYTSDLNSAYSSIFFFIREIFYGWCLRYLHSSGASFVFLFLFLHLGRAISYGSYFYNPNTWFSGIILFFFREVFGVIKSHASNDIEEVFIFGITLLYSYRITFLSSSRWSSSFLSFLLEL